MQRVRTTGSPAPARFGGHRRALLGPHESDLRRLVETSPDITLVEIQAELQCRHGVVAGLTTIDNALRRIGLRHKKKSLRAAEQDRPDVAASRRRWRSCQPFMDASRFVFLDETATATT